ncbi:hypothetical protein [Silvibacterium acidisoli]|uniref:hypothetical protein n=1 Tax=Acidobacteriaceae bacterium ZG23-2 TaxID=2883246 RepID=UPI00406C697F
MMSRSQLKVLVVGTAGPTAGLVPAELRKRSSYIRGLVHKKDDEEAALKRGCHEVAIAELSDAKAVAKALDGIDAVFYVAPVELKDGAANSNPHDIPLINLHEF